MIHDLKDPVTVLFVYNHRKKLVSIPKIVWNGRDYIIKKIGMHHTYKAGTTLMHVFSVVSESLAFKLVFDTSHLIWTLEQISDGLPN